jgi:anhydro-N-acetylmuramic acid kinase
MNNKIWYCIGVMSGTSLDGVDICYIRFNYNDAYDFEILKAITYKYSDTWKLALQNAFTADEKSLKIFDIEYGSYLGGLINQFIDKNEISNIDFIASHGHTIFHKPEEGYTLQIGNGQTIADITQLKVICDFRTQDVKLGGQGAPLVPIGDELLFYDNDYCLNLGGFVNVSFKEGNKRIAFDICPVNIVLNHYVNKLDVTFDDKGQLAASGNVNKQVLDKLNSLDYYHQLHPKSLGYEWIVDVIFPLIDGYHLEIKDILRTFVEHVAFQISKIIQKDSSVLITGGGAFNDFLIQRIEFYLDQKITLPSTQLIDFKEAIIFAFLGVLKLRGEVNILKSVTGAKKDHSSGVIFEPEEL